MASRLDALLLPDEKVIYRVQPTVWRNLRDFLKTFGPFAVVIVGLDVLAWLVGLYPLRISYGLLAFIGAFSVYIDFSCRDALLTDRRYIRRHGFLRPKVSEVPLSQVRDVIGLEPGSACGLGIRKLDNSVENLMGLPDSQRLALAIAESVGQALPQIPTPLSLRIRSGLIWTGLIGAFCGFFVVPIGAILIALSASSEPLLVPAVFAWIRLLVLVASSFLGWLIGPIGLLLVLRPKVSADDMRRALDPNYPPGIEPGGSKFHAFWFRPILMPVASWLYGQPMEPPGAPKGT